MIDVLSARSGLGYNSRGSRLRQAAKEIMVYKSKTTGSSFPDTYEELIKLSGVGDYIANAILAFAYNRDTAVIDTNIRRILIYQSHLDHKASLKELKTVALNYLPHGHARERYSALMDYGAMEFTAKKSGIVPLSRQSRFEGSRRQVRAWIIRQLVITDSKPKIDLLQNGTVHPLSIVEIKKRFPDCHDLEDIIQDLIREGLVDSIDTNQIKISCN
jgi:A/G-specific adenine glycosylase